MSKQNILFLLLITSSLLFCIFIAFDIFPFMRGPAPYPPDWQWPYLVSNTLTKLWAPVLAGSLILLFSYVLESSRTLKIKPSVALPIILLLGFIFQLSLLHYSRSGIGVLLHRILDPDITSYFTASTHVTSLSTFLRTFNQIFPTLPLFAGYHPPFGTLIFNLMTTILHPLTPFLGFITNLHPTQPDVLRLWTPLNPDQKVTAILSGFIIMMLSVLPIIPIYFTIKFHFNERLAYRATLLFILIPGIILFVPMNDVFMPLFSATSLYFFLKGINYGSKYSYFFSGLILVIGSLFTLTCIPIIFFYSVYGLLSLLRNKHDIYRLPMPVTSFSFGFLLLPFLLFLFTGFNFFESAVYIFHRHAIVEHFRQYSLGLFYAPFNFLLFLGVPLAFLVISNVFSLWTNGKIRQQNNNVTLSFWIFFILITISGTVRLETARVWTPYIPLALFVVISEIKKLHISNYKFLIMQLLLCLQLVIFQTVLVTVW